MKQLLLLLLIVPAFAFAQDCSGKIKTARASKAAGNYREALEQFTAAVSTCGDSRKEEIEREILDIFDRIDRLRNEAETAKKAAAAEAEKARASEKTAAEALSQVQEANRKTNEALESQKQIAENLARSNAECSVRLLLAEVERDQREYRFEAAVDKLEEARSLGVLSDPVEAARQNLGRDLLRNARINLQQKEYKPALAQIKSAEKLRIQPDSVLALSIELNQYLQKSIRQDILNTRYDAAADKVGVLRHLQAPKDTVENLWFEIIFCYTETGRLDRAAAMLDTFAQMRGDLSTRNLYVEMAGKDAEQQTRILRQTRRQLDRGRDDMLTTRYMTPVFRQIPAGLFSMGGSPDGAKNGCEVTVKAFSLAIREVTFFEYDLFCAATGRRKPTDNNWGRGLRPVINVSWYDAIEYCNWCSRRDGLQAVYEIPANRNEPVACNWAANGYRLPTEAEWEFAAGNGPQHTRYSWGNDPPSAQNGGNVADDMAKSASPGAKTFPAYSDGFVYTAPTGSYAPNAYGLYDMTGNVQEWCWDWFDENYCRANRVRISPQGPATGQERVMRGGHWLSHPDDCHVSSRLSNDPGNGKASVGFRLARN